MCDAPFETGDPERVAMLGTWVVELAFCSRSGGASLPEEGAAGAETPLTAKLNLCMRDGSALQVWRRNRTTVTVACTVYVLGQGGGIATAPKPVVNRAATEAVGDRWAAFVYRDGGRARVWPSTRAMKHEEDKRR